jgi:hypothetical protein
MSVWVSGRFCNAPALLSLAAVLSMFTLARPAAAESINMTFVGLAVSTPGPDGGAAGVLDFQGPTHLAQGTVGFFPGISGQPGSFNTFCMQATQDLISPHMYTVLYATPSTMSSWDSTPNLNGTTTMATTLLELFGAFFDGLGTANNPAFGGFGTSVNDQYAAFQDAIWDLEGNTVPSTLVPADVYNLTQYFLANPGTTEATNVVIFSDPAGQDQISVIDPVPAPPGALLAVIGAVGLVGFRRRGRPQLA